MSYHEAGRGLDIRRVTIVRGKDDPAKAIINDNKPLALALLGAEVGETVTVRQPTSELDIIVDRIERPEWEVGEAVVAGASTSVDGVELAPYLEWRGHAVDPRTASQGEAAAGSVRDHRDGMPGVGEPRLPDLCASEWHPTPGPANSANSESCAGEARTRWTGRC